MPLAIFYLALWLVGVWGALIGALAWSYAALAVRLILGKRVPGLLLLGTAAITVRTLISFLTGSVFVYFLQPTLGTVAIGLAFLLSVPVGRPLAERLAGDFVPLPHALASHPVARKVFLRITLLWAFVLLSNAAVTLWFLLTEPVGVFVMAKTASTAVFTVGAVALSSFWFRGTLRRHGLLAPKRPVGSRA